IQKIIEVRGNKVMRVVNIALDHYGVSVERAISAQGPDDLHTRADRNRFSRRREVRGRGRVNYQPTNSIVAYESGGRRALNRAEQLEEVDEMAEVVASLNLYRMRIDRTVRTQGTNYANERADHERTVASL